MKADTSEQRDALREVFGDLMPPSHAIKVGHSERVELDSERKLRARNKAGYRLNHWPIWIWTFFIAPGPLTFDLFAKGFDWRMAAWLGVVLGATGAAGLLGKLPGVEPAPYIIRFTEDRPNPLYRRICYTFAWSAVITFAVLNIAGLVWAIATGEWRLPRSPPRSMHSAGSTPRVPMPLAKLPSHLPEPTGQRCRCRQIGAGASRR